MNAIQSRMQKRHAMKNQFLPHSSLHMQHTQVMAASVGRSSSDASISMWANADSFAIYFCPVSLQQEWWVNMIRSLRDVNNSIGCVVVIKIPPPAPLIGGHRDPSVAGRRDWPTTKIIGINVTLNYFEKFSQTILHAAINILNCLNICAIWHI